MKSPLNTEKDQDTVITGIQEKTIICLVPNCTGSQACPLCQVHVSGGPTDPQTLPFWGSASNAAVPVSGAGAAVSKHPSRLSLVLRRSIGGWSEKTLDAVAGLEINSEPHCNRGLGRHCSYLRGIWHLGYTRERARERSVHEGPAGIQDDSRCVRPGSEDRTSAFTSHILSFFASPFSSGLVLFVSSYRTNRTIGEFPPRWWKI